MTGTSTKPALGLIAGKGRFPFLVTEEARREGYRVVCCGVGKDADPDLERVADVYQPVRLGELYGLMLSPKHTNAVGKEAIATKPNGTGLGMAIARSVVDLHGGGLGVESAPGRGTKVRVNLPTEPPA